MNQGESRNDRGRGGEELFAIFASIDVPASSALTQKQFGWHPVQPALIPDLGEGHYINGQSDRN